MINEIRSYIKGVVYECDPDLKMHDEYFVSDNISDNKLEVIPITIDLFYKGKNDVIEKFDTAYSSSINIQAALIDKRRINQLSYMKSLEST
jgi:hypothetical protein